MKTCAYCGQGNDDAASVCAGCGTGEFRSSGTPPSSAPKVEDSESAYRLRDILAEPVKLFRALVLLSTVVFVVWFLHLLLGRAFVTQTTWEALSWHGEGAVLLVPASVSWLTMLVWVAVAVGLWNFSRSARLVFALGIAVFTLMTLLAGVQVDTAYGSFLSTIINLANGAILVMSFTAPLKEEFA